jgi:hypothetical protein
MDPIHKGYYRQMATGKDLRRIALSLEARPKRRVSIVPRSRWRAST